MKMEEAELSKYAFSQVLSSEEIEIKSWVQFQDHLQSYGGDNRYKWCFRGQANSKWPLAPSIERLVPNRRRENVAYVERVLLGRFRRQAHFYIQRLPDDAAFVEWYALMQHWQVPTRLLDFTLSPYVALFFALRDRPNGCADCAPTHAAVWAIHHVALQSIAKAELGIRAPVDSGRLRKDFDNLIGQNEDVQFVMPIQPFVMNERLASQQGIFLCPSSLKWPFDSVISQPEEFRGFVKPGGCKSLDSIAKKLVIPLSERSNLMRELNRMNISSSSLFPGLDGYARSIRESYESLDDEQPFYKRVALETLEDFGWAG